MNPTQLTIIVGMFAAAFVVAIVLPLAAMVLDALSHVWPYLLIAAVFYYGCR